MIEKWEGFFCFAFLFFISLFFSSFVHFPFLSLFVFLKKKTKLLSPFSRRRGSQRLAVAVDRHPAVDAVEAELDRGPRLGRQRLGEEGREEELGGLSGKNGADTRGGVAVSCFFCLLLSRFGKNVESEREGERAREPEEREKERGRAAREKKGKKNLSLSLSHR